MRTPGGKPPSSGAPRGPSPAPRRCVSCQGSLRGSERSVPTQNVVQGFIGINNSSSSSHVWKLGTGPLSAAQAPDGPVGGLWVVSVLPVSTRGHLDGCAPVTLPVHPLSPASPCSVPRACARRPPRAGASDRHGRADRRDGAASVQVRAMRGVAAGIGDRPRAGGPALAPMTAGEPAHTRSPQPVHIPGDNFSMCRRRSPHRHPQLQVTAGGGTGRRTPPCCG